MKRRPNEGTSEVWAQLKSPVDVPLRRGAWYRIVSHTPVEAVVSVDGEPVSVPRPYLNIRAAPPHEWTVIRKPTVAARTPEVFRVGYIVCPGCRERVPLPPAQVGEQLCPRCSQIFPIAWYERYFTELSA
jgi:hypothetical protein